MSNIKQQTDFYKEIKILLQDAKNKVNTTINLIMTQIYWLIEQRIVEEVEVGESRAKYGKAILKTLSTKLSKDNLKNMRRFFNSFPESETASLQFKLSWSHYEK